MLRLYAVLFAIIFTPKTQVLSVKQSQSVLDVSVVVRAKEYTTDKDGKIRRGLAGCSGTYVSGNTIVTAAHCFGLPHTDIWIRGIDRISYRAMLTKIDPEHDLALLTVKEVRHHPYAHVGTKTRIGEQVINVGSPLMFEFLLSEGVVASVNFKDKHFKSLYLITTAMINPGSSGGGAFNAKGELIGVNTMSVGAFGWVGISMAVSATDVSNFLNGK